MSAVSLENLTNRGDRTVSGLEGGVKDADTGVLMSGFLLGQLGLSQLGLWDGAKASPELSQRSGDGWGPRPSSCLPRPSAPQHVPWNCDSSGCGVALGAACRRPWEGLGPLCPNMPGTQRPGRGVRGRRACAPTLPLPPEMPTVLCCILVLPWFGGPAEGGRSGHPGCG